MLKFTGEAMLIALQLLLVIPCPAGNHYGSPDLHTPNGPFWKTAGLARLFP